MIRDRTCSRGANPLFLCPASYLPLRFRASTIEDATLPVVALRFLHFVPHRTRSLSEPTSSYALEQSTGRLVHLKALLTMPGWLYTKNFTRITTLPTSLNRNLPSTRGWPWIEASTCRVLTASLPLAAPKFTLLGCLVACPSNFRTLNAYKPHPTPNAVAVSSHLIVFSVRN